MVKKRTAKIISQFTLKGAAETLMGRDQTARCTNRVLAAGRRQFRVGRSADTARTPWGSFRPENVSSPKVTPVRIEASRSSSCCLNRRSFRKYYVTEIRTTRSGHGKSDQIQKLAETMGVSDFEEGWKLRNEPLSIRLKWKCPRN